MRMNFKNKTVCDKPVTIYILVFFYVENELLGEIGKGVTEQSKKVSKPTVQENVDPFAGGHPVPPMQLQQKAQLQVEEK